MTHLMTRLALVAICASLGSLLVDGVRKDNLDVDENVANGKTHGVFDGVKSFQQASEGLGSAGAVAGQLVMNLESGVEGTVTQSTFDSSDGLKLHVVHSKANQGEIATPSKVPVLWTLEEETTYTLQNDGSNIKLSVQGVSLIPFQEGVEMYKSSGVMKACASKTDIKEKAMCERKKLYKYYTNNWSKYKKESYLTDPSHKLGRVLKTMYGSTATYYAIAASGGDSWEKIIYSLITIPAVAIDYFLLFPNSDREKVEIAMVRHEINTGEYAGLDFAAKNSAEFDASAFESQRSSGEVFARSGLNFGAMVAKGQLLDVEGVDVKGGTAKYILKFARACRPKQQKYKYNDASDYCRDDNGRVYWH